MKVNKTAVTTGIDGFDRLLGGGVFIGDNVVWYDDEGILATVFNLNLIKASTADKKYIIYVSFDRSLKNLLERLGKLADSPYLIVLDCFTHSYLIAPSRPIVALSPQEPFLSQKDMPSLEHRNMDVCASL